MKPILTIIIFVILLPIFVFSENSSGPFFGNGFHNGWADQTSIVLWTRLTKTPGLNVKGPKFLVPSTVEVKELDLLAIPDNIYKAQIPEEFTLDEMEGACPGTLGEVMLKYSPSDHKGKEHIVAWKPVFPEKNFTLQWKLNSLKPDTRYSVKLYARKSDLSAVSDSISGFFQTPPSPKTKKEIDFCIVTCNDYPRRDDLANGHKIYNHMLAMSPDFFVHTGDIEYYDKPGPYALTKELMWFKWDRIFALPNHRNFYRQVTSYFMKDDHDVLRDDAYKGMKYGTVSFEQGLEIFDKEQFPSNNLPYKTIRWGKDLQIWLMEGRNYRSPNNIKDGPDKTIWGKEQKDWLYKTIKESKATFKIITTPTPILGPDRKNKNDNYSNSTYKSEGDEIRAFLNKFDNVFICTGDRHWQYVTHFENTNLWEFSTGAGSDSHAEGWPPDDKKPEHRFLRVKGGFLKGSIFYNKNQKCLKFEHFDVDGNKVHEEIFKK